MAFTVILLRRGDFIIFLLWGGNVHYWVTELLSRCHDNVVSVADGCLDFGTIKVFEEAKLSLRMKNQGKYEIAYKWVQTAWFWPVNLPLYQSGLHKQILFYHRTCTVLLFTCFLFFLSTRFTFERTDASQPNLDSILTVFPQSGVLMPHKKPTTVQIVCKPMTELSIIDQPVLPCQVWVKPTWSHRNNHDLLTWDSMSVALNM